MASAKPKTAPVHRETSRVARRQAEPVEFEMFDEDDVAETMRHDPQLIEGNTEDMVESEISDLEDYDWAEESD